MKERQKSYRKKMSFQFSDKPTIENTDINNTKLMDEIEYLKLENYRPKYTPLSRTDFNLQVVDQWQEIRPKNPPKRRSFHSSFVYKDYLYIYGGLDILTGKLNDMLKLNLQSENPEWVEVIPEGNKLGINYK